MTRLSWTSWFSWGRLWGLLLVVGTLAAAPQQTTAQQLWLPPYQPMQFAVEGVQPDIRNIEGLSGGYFITGTVSLTAGTELVAEVPVAYFRTNEMRPGADTKLGNPYVGLALTPDRSPLMIEVGGRIPVAENTSTTVLGQHAEVGRPGAFLPEGGMLTLAGNARVAFSRQLSLRLRAGGFYAHSTDAARAPGMPRVDRDLFTQYSTVLWYEGDTFTTGLGFAGHANLTGRGGYGEKSQHDLAATIHITGLPVVTPGVFAGWKVSNAFRDSESWQRAQNARRDMTSWRFGVTLSTTLY
jgi:hypothetical protein